MTDRRAVHKVVDIMEGHGEGGEGQDHALVHIALLKAVAPSSAPAASTPQLICTGSTNNRQYDKTSSEGWRSVPWSADCVIC